MLLKKKYITSNASRNFIYIKLIIYNVNIFKKLNIKLFKNKSTDIKGKKLIYHKVTSIFKNKIILLNNKINIKKIGFISNLHFCFNFYKIYWLINCYNNLNFYKNSFEKKNYNNNLLFSYFIFNLNAKNKFFFELNNFHSFIFFFSHFTKISHITSFNNGCVYSTSSGSFSIINYINRRYNLIKIILPSKEMKYFHFLDICSNGLSSFKDKKKLKISKAGFKKIKNKKVKVRGVAKNPVDHPHGGNTKSIRFPRTPWGKPTKLK